jgi:hypothetical protein
MAYRQISQGLWRHFQREHRECSDVGDGDTAIGKAVEMLAMVPPNANSAGFSS